MSGVGCFRTAEKGRERHGIWIMTGDSKDSRRGVFSRQLQRAEIANVDVGGFASDQHGTSWIGVGRRDFAGGSFEGAGGLAGGAKGLQSHF